MKFKYRSKILFTSILFNLVVITSFFYLIFNSYEFEGYSTTSKVQAAYSANLSVLQEEISDGSTINVNNIYIDKNLNGVIYYIVQKGDNLSQISANFGVSVSHIKKINKLKKDTIKPGQKLTITDEEGVLYISKGESAKDLSKKYKISKSSLLESNGLNVKNYDFNKGDEVFIPISNKEYEKLFKKNNKKPVVSKSVPSQQYDYSGKSIIAKYWYNPNVTNGFYRGHCTRYVAIKKFPYITKNKQKKLWNGNAKYWYNNAKNAGYRVGKTPKKGSIVVIKVGGQRYYYAGHVAIVKEIDWKNRKLLVEEMNAVGKYIVTKRWIPLDKKIIGYIYM